MDDLPEAVPLESEEDAEVEGPSNTNAELGPVPVTLITGFLGSGKTTLVRHLLSEDHGLRIAVILNEFGESVEGAYWQDLEAMKAMSGEWVELDNGCLCCSVKNDFVQALESLMRRKQKPQCIVIETTGLANPGPVAAALWTDEEVEAGVQLDSIITVVDSININRQLHEPRSEGAVNEAQVQVAYADLVLLNKMDLCSEEAVVHAEAGIRAINSNVHIVRTKHCAVDWPLLLNRQGYKHGAHVELPPIAEEDIEALPAHQPKPQRSRSRRTSMASNSSQSSHASRIHSRGDASPSKLSLETRVHSGDCLEHEPCLLHHTHDTHIQTVCLKSQEPLELERLKTFLDKLLWDRETHPEDIYRVKGAVCLKGDPRRHMVQAVYELYNITPGSQWQPNESKLSKVVIIGRNLNKQALQEWFALTQAG